MNPPTVRVLFLDSFKTTQVRTLPFRPMVGDRVEWSFDPAPCVSAVLIVADPDGFDYDLVATLATP